MVYKYGTQLASQYVHSTYSTYQMLDQCQLVLLLSYVYQYQYQYYVVYSAGVGVVVVIASYQLAAMYLGQDVVKVHRYISQYLVLRTIIVLVLLQQQYVYVWTAIHTFFQYNTLLYILYSLLCVCSYYYSYHTLLAAGYYYYYLLLLLAQLLLILIVISTSYYHVATINSC